MQEPEGTTICRDGTRCENYSSCTEYPSNEGKFFCDCDSTTTLSGGFSYAGVYCEHKATALCKKDHFCTNDGRCAERRGESGATFQYCDCSGTNFVGPNCAFVRGSEPFGWATADYGRRSSATPPKLSAGGIAGVVLAVVCLVGIGIAFLFIRKFPRSERAHSATNGTGSEVAEDSLSPRSQALSKKRHSTRHIGRLSNTDLQLDPDGGMLQDAMKDSDDFHAEDDDDVVDVEII